MLSFQVFLLQIILFSISFVPRIIIPVTANPISELTSPFPATSTSTNTITSGNLLGQLDPFGVDTSTLTLQPYTFNTPLPSLSPLSTSPPSTTLLTTATKKTSLIPPTTQSQPQIQPSTTPTTSPQTCNSPSTSQTSNHTVPYCCHQIQNSAYSLFFPGSVELQCTPLYQEQSSNSTIATTVYDDSNNENENENNNGNNQCEEPDMVICCDQYVDTGFNELCFDGSQQDQQQQQQGQDGCYVMISFGSGVGMIDCEGL